MTMTGFVPVMWSVWGAFVLLFIVVKIFTGRVARDEESQIFLGDSMQQEKSAQAAIAAKVNKIEPFRKATMGLVGLATVFVIGYYLFDIYRQFKG
jgi:cellobiose-specific phosphotransferase system component IIC